MRRSYELVVVALAACVGEDEYQDLTGVWAIEREVASMPCGLDHEVAASAPYLKLAESVTLAGFTMFRCSDAAATSCTGTEPIDSFSQHIEGGGWLGTIYEAGDSLPCLLTFTQQVAKLRDGKLVVDVTVYSEETTLARYCTPFEASVRGNLMPCTSHTRIDATLQ